MKTTNIKTLAAALAAIISVGVLSSCTANTAQTNPEPSETTIAATSQTTTAQPQTTSAKETTPSSTKPETQTEKTTTPTSAAPSTAAPATTAASTTKPAPASTTPATTVQSVKVDNATPAPEWTESAVSGTMYVQVVGIYSRSKAVLGAPTVKQYNLNDTVSVTAVTNTGYYKLSDGSFIHADYLGADKVTAQTASTTKPSTSSAAPTVSKPAATTKAQSSTTKPASTTKKQSTTTPSSGSSQSGGDWKGYDMDDPDFPWDEYLKETDDGGSNFNWDDLFGNMTMPWEEEEKEPECVTEWRNMSDAEREEITNKLDERVAYYFGQEIGHKQILLSGLTKYAKYRTSLLDNHDHQLNIKAANDLKYGQYRGNGKWESPIASEGANAGAVLYGFDDKSIDKCAYEIVMDFKGSPAHWSYMGADNQNYIGVGCIVFIDESENSPAYNYLNYGGMIFQSGENTDLETKITYELGSADKFFDCYLQYVNNYNKNATIVDFENLIEKGKITFSNGKMIVK